MPFTGTLPSLKRGLMHNNRSALPEKFKYNDLQEREVIGRGSCGIVYKARYHDETVVVKNIMGESTEDENSFVKEAKLLGSLQHKHAQQVSNLVDFLNCVDKIDGFKAFHQKLHIPICIYQVTYLFWNFERQKVEIKIFQHDGVKCITKVLKCNNIFVL